VVVTPTVVTPTVVTPTVVTPPPEVGSSELTELIPPRSDIALLPHQVIGVRWMLQRELDNPICRGGILADDMGLGKTFQTISLLKNSPYSLSTLILCPPALLSGWTKELTDCGFSVRSILQILKDYKHNNNTVCVATYNHAHIHSHSYCRASFQRVILDEGHIIRNGKATKRWFSCLNIAADATCRWILSATPVQNGVSDWNNLCSWLKAANTTPSSHIMLRRTMDELRAFSESFPPPPVFIQHSLHIPPESSEGKLFRSLAHQLLGVVNNTQSPLVTLELYMRVQQFLVHPQLFIQAMRSKFKGAYPRPDWTGSATKFSAFSAVLASSTDPTVVFCHFRAEMDLVESLCVSLGRSVWSIRGGIGSDAIASSIQQAKISSSPVVIIVQIVAGGAGLNLQFCSRILFLSQHWNPAVVHQACGRCVRIGQLAPVQIHFFSVQDDVADNIDRRMFELHLAKISAARGICASLYHGGFW